MAGAVSPSVYLSAGCTFERSHVGGGFDLWYIFVELVLHSHVAMAGTTYLRQRLGAADLVVLSQGQQCIGTALKTTGKGLIPRYGITWRSHAPCAAPWRVR